MGIWEGLKRFADVSCANSLRWRQVRQKVQLSQRCLRTLSSRRPVRRLGLAARAGATLPVSVSRLACLRFPAHLRTCALCGTPRALDGPLSSVTHHCSSHLLCVCLDLQPMLRPRLPSSQGCIFRAARAATSVPPLRSPSGSHRPRVGQQHGGRLRPDRSGHVNRQGRCGGHCPQPMQQ